MTTQVIARLPAAVQVINVAIYGTDYTNFGFVFGQRRGGQWRFFVADTGVLGGGCDQTIVPRLR